MELTLSKNRRVITKGRRSKKGCLGIYSECGAAGAFKRYGLKKMKSKSEKIEMLKKIITRENDDADTIKSIIKSKKPEVLILESGSAYGLHTQLRMNQKTYWIAQNLASDGWKIDRLKYYKGKLLKVILSLK